MMRDRVSEFLRGAPLLLPDYYTLQVSRMLHSVKSEDRKRMGKVLNP
jgi:hypothetical protein